MKGGATVFCFIIFPVFGKRNPQKNHKKGEIFHETETNKQNTDYEIVTIYMNRIFNVEATHKTWDQMDLQYIKMTPPTKHILQKKNNKKGQSSESTSTVFPGIITLLGFKFYFTLVTIHG